ncbi:MAG: 2-oxoacid:acceptor oxidoreductase family protein [Planctomycetaceae bacterium]|nr:2-oxoacid:acceptor oxidoreductase family protein [Planctomycetaceae bacterium]MCA9098332.1 2-oxoacid:acceptor oxidoreductase family protein [Planctomycetaceae bacterium]
MDATSDYPLTIQIAGLGGQGVVLAGDILAEAALLADLNVKKSEIHGLSRRFGSVSCQVRIGTELYSPLRGHGGVDILLALEGYEGLKHLPYLTSEGRGLFNRMWRKPGAVTNANDTAPVGCDDQRVSWFDGTELMHQAECIRSLNYFMLGVLGTRLPIPEEAWDQAITGITTKGLATNLEMFRTGRRIGLASGPRYRYRVVTSELSG